VRLEPGPACCLLVSRCLGNSENGTSETLEAASGKCQGFFLSPASLGRAEDPEKTEILVKKQKQDYSGASFMYFFSANPAGSGREIFLDWFVAGFVTL
jgi:hypothetical protein